MPLLDIPDIQRRDEEGTLLTVDILAEGFAVRADRAIKRVETFFYDECLAVDERSAFGRVANFGFQSVDWGPGEGFGE